MTNDILQTRTLFETDGSRFSFCRIKPAPKNWSADCSFDTASHERTGSSQLRFQNRRRSYGYEAPEPQHTSRLTVQTFAGISLEAH